MAKRKIQIIPPDGGYVDVLHPETSADQVLITDTSGYFVSVNVEGALSELFSNVDSGKNTLYSSLSTKGIVPASKDFSALNIAINTSDLVRTNGGTAVSGNILSGMKAYVNGALVTGTMVNNAVNQPVLNTQNQQYSIPAGYHSAGGKVTASFSNLSAGNIKSGVNVGGVVGTYKQIKQMAFYSFTGLSNEYPTYNLPATCDVSNSILFVMLSGSNGGAGGVNVELTSTQIICTNAYAGRMPNINFIFIEFEPGVIKSKQTLSFSYSGYGGSSGSYTYTKTFNAVNVTKTIFLNRIAGMQGDGEIMSTSVINFSSTSATFHTDTLDSHLIDIVEFY